MKTDRGTWFVVFGSCVAISFGWLATRSSDSDGSVGEDRSADRWKGAYAAAPDPEASEVFCNTIAVLTASQAGLVRAMPDPAAEGAQSTRSETSGWPSDAPRADFDIGEWLLRGGGVSEIRVARHTRINPADNALTDNQLKELRDFLRSMFSSSNAYRDLAMQAAMEDKVRQIEEGLVTAWSPPVRTARDLERDARDLIVARRSHGEELSLEEASRRIESGEVRILAGPADAVIHGGQIYPSHLFQELPSYDRYFDGMKAIAEQQAILVFCWFESRGISVDPKGLEAVIGGIEAMSPKDSYSLTAKKL